MIIMQKNLVSYKIVRPQLGILAGRLICPKIVQFWQIYCLMCVGHAISDILDTFMHEMDTYSAFIVKITYAFHKERAKAREKSLSLVIPSSLSSTLSPPTRSIESCILCIYSSFIVKRAGLFQKRSIQCNHPCHPIILCLPPSFPLCLPPLSIWRGSDCQEKRIE